MNRLACRLRAGPLARIVRHERGGPSMSEEIVFYTNPMSRGRIARWMLEEVGQPYRTEVLEYGTTMKAAEYLSINPMGKVPAIRHRGVTVTECAAICAYLADAFPGAGLAPAFDDPARGTYLRWMFFAAGPVDAAVTAKSLGLLAPAEKSGMAGYGSYEQMVDALETAVEAGPYILGERFSAADVYVGSQIGWGLQFKTLPDRPTFAAYVARIMQRPAAARARELDDALIPART
jgi:glutathione S-transferase